MARGAQHLTGFVHDITSFADALRREGVPADTSRVLLFAEALTLGEPGEAYWAGRATLVTSRDQISAYDRVFAAYYGSMLEPSPSIPIPLIEQRIAGVIRPLEDGLEEPGDRPGAPASPVEHLRRKRFEDCTAAEMAELQRQMSRIAWAVPERRSRRREPHRRGSPDLRATVRDQLNIMGAPPRIRWRRQRRTGRPLVLLLDVSASMAGYSRALLLFGRMAIVSNPRWEVFCFGTRLTHVTRALRAGTVDDALRAASLEVLDWHGGTRIADALQALLVGWGQTRALRGAVVVICSDGLETGGSVRLGEEMRRLARVAHTVVWLNPLKGLEGYEPLAKGMQAALPHIDLFASGDNLQSLEAVARQIATLTGPMPG